MAVCNKDCFNCPFPDCINDEMDYEDYLDAATTEREIILPKSKKEKKAAARQKAYYEANREKVAARQKAYREANREKAESMNANACASAGRQRKRGEK